VIFPRLDRFSFRFFRVWQRNFAVYRKTWKIAFLPPLFEPLLYILAFSLGLAVMVGEVGYAGQQLGYTEFIAPALVSVAVMYNAFFETTYNSFVRMTWQKTYDGMVATPLNFEEVILGEIAWAATKAVIAATLMGAVISLFGLFGLPGAFLLIPLALLGGLLFAALGMICTALVPGIESFNIPIFLGITPMFLFSGTFFPLTNLPAWAQGLAWLLPLTHLAALARACALGLWSPWNLVSLVYLLLAVAILIPLAIGLMVRRLVPSN